MIYKDLKYSLVSEKTKDGVTYTAYRCDNRPQDCIIIHDDIITETQNLRDDWKALCQ